MRILVFFQNRYIHDAATNLPISNAVPMTPTAIGAPGKMAINPAIENQAATELMNNAESKVMIIIILNVFDVFYT